MNFIMPNSIKNKERLSVKFEVVNKKVKNEVIHFGLKATKEVQRSIYIMIENDYEEPTQKHEDESPKPKEETDEEQTINLRYCLPNVVKENKLSSLYFKASFGCKLKLLKRNSFMLILFEKADKWLDENIDKIHRRGGVAFFEKHYQNKAKEISNCNEVI